jgi:hypothetical protein
MSAFEQKHPLFAHYYEDWEMMRDLYHGERVVKDKGVMYLPATPGMVMDGMSPNAPGRIAYDNYKHRAVFHDFVKEAVQAYIGLLHQKPPTIELPPELEAMREQATAERESLEQLLRRINEGQLLTGRIGLLLDVDTDEAGAPMPYIATYDTERVSNWDNGGMTETNALESLNLVILNESGLVRGSDFAWRARRKYRVLMLATPDVSEQVMADLEDGDSVNGEGLYAPDYEVGEPDVFYAAGVFEDDQDFAPELMINPMIRGQKLDEIPFVFINTKDIVSRPDDPPLLGLGRLSLAIYRAEADYRQCLFMQAQDTLVVIGGKEGDDIRTGAGASINVDIGGDAKYIGVGAVGLPEMRSSLENDMNQARAKSGQLVSTAAQNVESGEALKTRIAAQTATLNQIALTGAAGLQKILQLTAKWLGADPTKVVVTPNLEFADFMIPGQELLQLMTAKNMGAPISKESIHGVMVDRGLTQNSFEEEMDQIADEDPLLGTVGLPGGPGGVPLNTPVDPNAPAPAAGNTSQGSGVNNVNGVKKAPVQKAPVGN